MAFKAPSGLTVPPEQIDDFIELTLQDDGAPYGTVYVAREVWDALDPRADELIFYIQDYGRFRLKLHRPTVEGLPGANHAL
jgi:hypothetical protein